MRCLSKCLLVIGVAALIASPAVAQERRGGGRGGFGAGGLVNNEAVQKELKLSPDEVTKGKEALQGITEKYQEEFAKLRELDQEERQAKMRELQPKQAEETYAALEKVWKPEQVKRLKQIGVQTGGLQAFTSPAAKSLKLSDEQKEKFQALAGEQREEMQGLFGGGGDQAENMKKLTTMRKEFTAKGLALLTPEQKKEWKELTGDPFDVPMGPGGARGGKGGKGGKRKSKDGGL
ncbi:hypothetical protein BH10PLA2_BH10PLA2_31580 [soil metagenome]